MSTTEVRPELTKMPDRIKALPVDKRGYPIPWFVAYINGEPEFRVADKGKFVEAIRKRLCWVCGQKLGANLVFVLGPMCGITKTTSEPPVHRECAMWSAVNCPFLNKPHMVRRQPHEMDELGAKSSGIPIKRNPGVVLLWITHTFTVFKPAPNEALITVGPALEVEWYAEGRKATRQEIVRSVEAGLPFLEEVAQQQEGAMEALHQQLERFQAMLPRD